MWLTGACLAGSIMGAWPFMIEPYLLKTTHLTWPLPTHSPLKGLKITHLSDLHFHKGIPARFLNRILQKISDYKPDLILFTGDFLCCSQLEAPEKLEAFLSRFEAPLGVFCCLGNHDYAAYVSCRQGVYETSTPPGWFTALKNFKTLFSSSPGPYQVSERVASLGFHEGLIALLKKTPFKLLENETITLPCGLNICGLGEVALGRACPEKAFAHYDPAYPGIILVHNPDTLPSLRNLPGEWILTGHTHGEQIHLPWPSWARTLSKRLTHLQHLEYTRGFYSLGGHPSKFLYVNRGLGSHKPFRLGSPPEICFLQIV